MEHGVWSTRQIKTFSLVRRMNDTVVFQAFNVNRTRFHLVKIASWNKFNISWNPVAILIRSCKFITGFR